jgi:hypothetical protein
MSAELSQMMIKFRYLSLLCVALLATGCSKSPYELAPVHGKVAVDDKPLFQGKIRFAPVAQGSEINSGKPAFGKIESDGTFRLTTFEPNDGAVVGEHWVTILNIGEDLPDGVPEFARVTLPEKVTVVLGKDNEINVTPSRELVRKYREDDT